MRKRTLGFKLVAGGMLAVAIPLLIIGIFAVVKSSGALETTAKGYAAERAARLADLVQQALSLELKALGEIAVSSEAAGAAAGLNVAAMDKRLADAMAKSGKEIEVTAVLDPNGISVADGIGGKTKGISVNDRDYFRTAKSGRAAISDVVKSKNSGEAIVNICVPVIRDGKFAGAVMTAMKMDYISEKVTAKMSETGYGFITDRTGLVVAHPDRANILALNIAQIGGMEEIAKKALAHHKGVHEYVFKGKKKIAGYAPVPSTGWSVILTQEEAEVLAPAHAIRNFIVVVGIAFLIAAAVAVAYFARGLSAPIRKAVEEMGESAHQVASASGEVSAASQSLAEGAAQQASALQETSSSLEELTSMTRQNAGNAAQADGLMKQTAQVIQKAQGSMDNLTKAMSDITTASGETSKIVKTIDEIAFQTNLLALNAAVEAARAGEAGAGFAVVADEVRNLAMRAAEAARTTSNLIDGTVQKIREGSVLVDETEAAFTEVSGGTLKMGELVAEIAAASQEQSHGIDQIGKAIAEMDKMTQSTAATAEESAAASEEMNAQAEQMKSISLALVGIVGGGAGGDSRGGQFMLAGQ